MKARLAEWILSLALPPDRAASAVGDWMEDSFERGPLWFWSCVFRTVSAQVWSDLRANPGVTVRLGLAGVGRNGIVALAILVAISQLTRWIHYPDIGNYPHGWIWTAFLTNTAKDPGYLPHWELRTALWPAAWLLYLSRLVLTGRWITLRMPAREMAGAISVAFMGWICLVAVDVLTLPRPVIRFSPELFGLGIADDMILIAGAVWMRRRSWRITTR